MRRPGAVAVSRRRGHASRSQRSAREGGNEMSSTDFTVEIAQNEYLPEGGEDVNAIVTLTSPDTGLAAPVDDRGSADIIIIDCSRSMRSPRTNIEQARAATAAPLDVLTDAVAVAVIPCTT